MAKLHSALPCEITSPFTREIISVLHSKACNNLYIFHSYSGKLRASEARETPSIATYRKKMFGRKYIKTTMRMLTILREAEEWTRVHPREDCLLFASAIKKCSLYLHQNDTAQAHQTRRRKYVYQTRML